MGYWITVVDDEPISLTNAKKIIRENDMKVTCLRSGKELLEFVADHRPDLILLDILMPEMDGFDTYRLLRQLEEKESRTNIPVIFLTGDESDEAQRRGMETGASDYLHKPFDREVLIKSIEKTINKGDIKEEDLFKDIECVSKIMLVREEEKGALLLEHDAFSWNYSFIDRFLSRYGGAATKILFSLSSDEVDIIFSEVVLEFGNVLKDTLRKSDIIIKWQNSKYFVVLPMLSEINAKTVIDRIMDRWKLSGYNERTEVKYASSTVVK